MVPFGLDILKTAIPTGIRGNSQTLIDYIVTDHTKAEGFVTFISDTPFRTTKDFKKTIGKRQ